VFPAAGLLTFVPKSRLVIINRDITHRDENATLVFHEELKDVFKRLANWNNEK
jgi:hypothetical protein